MGHLTAREDGADSRPNSGRWKRVEEQKVAWLEPTSFTRAPDRNSHALSDAELTLRQGFHIACRLGQNGFDASSPAVEMARRNERAAAAERHDALISPLTKSAAGDSQLNVEIRMGCGRWRCGERQGLRAICSSRGPIFCAPQATRLRPAPEACDRRWVRRLRRGNLQALSRGAHGRALTAEEFEASQPDEFAPGVLPHLNHSDAEMPGHNAIDQCHLGGRHIRRLWSWVQAHDKIAIHR